MTVGLVMLDRDGTINRKAPEGEYVMRPDALELLPGAASAIRALNEAAIPVAVVTNQRGVALGRFDETDLEAVHDAMQARLDEAAGAHVDAIFHCPHERETCGCRKPGPGLLVAAAQTFGVVPSATLMIGDAESDVEAGRRFGARTIQVTTGRSSSALTAPDLATAVRMVLG